MTGPTTFHSRIFALLELAGKGGFRTAEELIHVVVRRSPPNFVNHRWNSQTNKIDGRCSESAVRKTFEFAVTLGLLDGDSGCSYRRG